jgi:hypothetical protein
MSVQLAARPRHHAEAPLPPGRCPQLKANFTGTEYVLLAKRCATNHNMTKSFQQQVLAVNFKSTVLSVAGGPRSMSVVLPAPDANVGRLVPRNIDLAACLDQARTRKLEAAAESKLSLLHSNPPLMDKRSKSEWPAWCAWQPVGCCLLVGCWCH